jgi:hypothetical protein
MIRYILFLLLIISCNSSKPLSLRTIKRLPTIHDSSFSNKEFNKKIKIYMLFSTSILCISNLFIQKQSSSK